MRLTASAALGRSFLHHHLCFSSQGTVNNQSGIFPQSFVKIIKPLPDVGVEDEDEGHTYSCLRCFLLGPAGVDTRWAGGGGEGGNVRRSPV